MEPEPERPDAARPVRIAGLPREITDGAVSRAVGPARPLLGATVGVVLLGVVPAALSLWLWVAKPVQLCIGPCPPEEPPASHGLAVLAVLGTVLLVLVAPFIASRMSGWRAWGVPMLALFGQPFALAFMVLMADGGENSAGLVAGVSVALGGVLVALTIRPPEASASGYVFAGESWRS